MEPQQENALILEILIRKDERVGALQAQLNEQQQQINQLQQQMIEQQQRSNYLYILLLRKMMDNMVLSRSNARLRGDNNRLRQRHLCFHCVTRMRGIRYCRCKLPYVTEKTIIQSKLYIQSLKTFDNKFF